MERKNVKLDENWITPSALAAQLGVARTSVSNWIIRNQIDYFRLPGALTRGCLVDQRTAPKVQKRGRPKKKV